MQYSVMMTSSTAEICFLLSAIICFRSLLAVEEGVINFRIEENEPLGSLIGNIAQQLRTLENVSSEIRENTHFTFLNPNAANNIYFALDPSSGELTTSSEKIDRETVCPYKVDCSLEINVAVKSAEGFFDVATIRVEILDINDNKPTFPKSLVVLNVSENIPAGKEYPLDKAEDADMWGNNSIQSYELIQEGDLFKLEVEKHRYGSYSLKLILEQSLDREMIDFYAMAVVAKDGGDPVREGVLNIEVNIIDANDNSPIFEKDYYNVTVKESISPGTVILRLSASDADDGKNKEISYRFGEKQSDIDVIRRLFYVNENSGELSVIHDLHSEQSESFEFFVEAVDHGDPVGVNQTAVLVKIEDAGNNAPVITLHLLASDKIGFVNLSESEKPGAFVAHINVEDTDSGENGNVSCRSENNFFGIEKLPVRGYKIVLVKSLDRETLPLHEITVTCYDNGTPSLSSSVSFLVSVKDANDNAPKFTKDTYKASNHENNDMHDTIIEVSATDKDIGNNKLFEYFLHPEDETGLLSVNNNTGIVYATDRLDRETDPLIVFRVIAIDKGDPKMTGTATVSLTVLDENDNIPHIIPARPKLKIMENMPADTSLGFLVGKDNDEGLNSKLSFSIAPVSTTFPFKLTPSGEFRTTKALDRELQNRYEIPVTVSDLGLKPLSNTQYVTITVTDANDNTPIITFPNSDNDSVDFVYPVVSYNVVTSVAAYDVDDGENGTLTYSILEGNHLGIFEIDSKIGEISVTKFIDIEKDVTIPLLIKVQDNGEEPKYTTSILKVNLIYSNATVAQPQDGSSNKYIVISVVVVVATLLLAIAIVGVLLFLRSLDRNKGRDGENGSAGSSDSGISSHPDSQSNSRETENDTIDSKKKKKEVSFSLDFSLDGLDGGRNVETSTDSDPLNNRYYDPPPSYQTSLHSLQQEKIDSHMKALKLQQYLWEAKSREWENTNTQVQHLPLGDSESETSRDTVTCDSGRGGSEDDVSTSSPSADDRRSFGFTDTKSSGKHVTFHPQHYTNHSPSNHIHSVRQSTPVRAKSSASTHSNHNRNSFSNMPRKDFSTNDTKLMIKNFKQFNHQNTLDHIQTVPVSRVEPWRDLYDHHTRHSIPKVRHDSFSSVRSNDDDGGSTTTSGSYTLDPEGVELDLFPSHPNQMVV